MEKDGHVFAETWLKAQSWFVYKDALCSFFKKNAHDLGLGHIESFMTIGPGEGTIEKEIMTACMPCLKTFIAVEPTAVLLDKLKANMSCISNMPNIQITCLNQTMQDYEGPANPVQLVFLCHSLYYAADDLEQQITRFMQWLTPEGVMIVIIQEDEEHGFVSDFRDTMLTFWPDQSCGSSKIKATLQTLKLDYEEYHVPLPINASCSLGKKEFFEILVHEKCTEEQVAVMSDVVYKHWNPETGDIGMKQSVLILRKT